MPIQCIEPRRLYRQIAEQIRKLTHSGEVPAGARLPPERDLARQAWRVMSVGLDSELAAVLERAGSGPILWLYLIGNRKGRPISVYTHGRAWRAAIQAVGISNAHFHDIRAKYATDAKRLGLDYKATSRPRTSQHCAV